MCLVSVHVSFLALCLSLDQNKQTGLFREKRHCMSSIHMRCMRMEILMCFCIGFVVGSVECGWSKAQFGETPGWKGRETLNKDFPDKKRMGKILPF